MAPSTQDGLVRTFREDGSMLAETTFQGGRRHGPFRDYWPTGMLASEGNYLNDVQEGEWRFYHDDGTIMEVIQFKGGREVIDWDALFARAESEE
jgi:antitoxin component YwqK of YwqJK toxin-antitoxin module